MTGNLQPRGEVPVSQGLIYLALGPCFVGWALQIFLSGICLSSAARHMSPRTSLSPPRTQRLLQVVTILNMIVTGITAWEVYYWGCLLPGSYDAIFSYTVPDALVTLPSGFLATLVQCIFAERAWRALNRSYWFLGIVGLLIVTALGGSIAQTVANLNNRYSINFELLMAVSCVRLMSTALADVTISLVLVGSLYRFREGVNSMNDTFRWIVNLSFKTAAMTSVFAITSAILAIACFKFNSTNVYLAFAYPLPAIYTLSYVWSVDASATARMKREGLTSDTRMQRPSGLMEWEHPERQVTASCLHYHLSPDVQQQRGRTDSRRRASAYSHSRPQDSRGRERATSVLRPATLGPPRPRPAFRSSLFGSDWLSSLYSPTAPGSKIAQARRETGSHRLEPDDDLDAGLEKMLERLDEADITPSLEKSQTSSGTSIDGTRSKQPLAVPAPAARAPQTIYVEIERSVQVQDPGEMEKRDYFEREELDRRPSEASLDITPAPLSEKEMVCGK